MILSTDDRRIIAAALADPAYRQMSDEARIAWTTRYAATLLRDRLHVESLLHLHNPAPWRPVSTVTID